MAEAKTHGKRVDCTCKGMIYHVSDTEKDQRG